MVLELKLTVLSGGELKSDFHENFLEIIYVWGKKIINPVECMLEKQLLKMHQRSHFRLTPFIKIGISQELTFYIRASNA